jgi:hypothetical protein
MTQLGVIDESKRYRCDTPIMLKIEDNNLDLRSNDRIQIQEMESRLEIWGAIYSRKYVNQDYRVEVSAFLSACKDVDYTQYVLPEGQLCSCDKCGKEESCI